MKFSFASVFTKLTVAATVATALTSCGEPEYATPTPATSASTAQSRYLIVNAAPGSGAGQLVSIDNVNATAPPAPVPYLGVSAYTPIAAGSRLLQLSTTNNLNNLQIPVRGTFATNLSNTVFLTDPATRAASGTDPGGSRAIVLADNLTPPAAGKAKIRFINLAASGTYGLFISGSSPVTPLFTTAPTRSARGTTTTINGSTVTFANFTEVNAGTYTLDVRASATANPVSGTQQTFTLADGKIYTLYIRGIAGNSATPLGISQIVHN